CYAVHRRRSRTARRARDLSGGGVVAAARARLIVEIAMSEIPFTDPTPYVGLPPMPRSGDADWFQALEQFVRVFAIRPGERVLMLTDPLLDRRVVEAVSGIARARGATLTQYMAPNTSLPAVPDEVKAIIEKADFVVSTWFCSIEDPF